MGRHSGGEPDGIRSGGSRQPWGWEPPSDQQPMPPCGRCGAPFAAHVSGTCPQVRTSVDGDMTQQPGFAGSWQQTGAALTQEAPQPYASWAPPSRGLPGGPQLAGVVPRPRSWLRRHPWLTALIAFVVLFAVSGITIKALNQPNGNAAACSDYWSIKNNSGSDTATAATSWHNLQTVAPEITNSGLATAVGAFNEAMNNDETTDASTASIAIGTACAALGYSNPG